MRELGKNKQGILDKTWTRGSLAVAGAAFFGGITIAWLSGQGFLGELLPDPRIILGLSIMLSTVLVCCVTSGMITRLLTKMPEYHEMELQFDKAMAHYEEEEWDKAIAEFNELLEPDMDHKRALYYAARCYEQKDNWEKVKEYCQHYLDMQPDDKEVWELLALAYKRLFEYEEAEEARSRASELG